MKPLFQTSTKYFVNFNLHIQQSLYDFHQSQLNDFFAEVDVEASQKTITIPIKKGFKGLYLNTISEYRQKLLENQKQNTLSLESFIIKKRNSPKLEKTSRFPIENKPSIRYSFYFFLSILKMRQLYEDPLIQNYHHSNIFNYSEYDLQYKLDDFFNFLSKYPQNIYETFKSFFIKMFDEAQFNWFHSFNPIVFESFYKEILKPIEKHKHVEISVKNSNYLFLPLGRNQSKDIFEYIINTPPEDPIEIFSLNRNHEFSYNYNRSKNFFEYVVKNHYELEYKFTSQKETAFLNEVNPSFNQENLNENVRDFLDFLTESFTATVDSPLMNLINLLTKIVKIFGDEIKIEKIDLFSKMFQENLEDNESLNEDKNDISLIDDPDDKKDGISEENSKSSLSKIKDFEKSQILDENLSSINIDSFREKNGISLNFGKSNLILKRKRDVNNEMNEKSIELDEENSPETSLKKISTVKKRREIKFNDVKSFKFIFCIILHFLFIFNL